MQFHRITRLKHIHRAADGGEIRPGDPDRVRVRIFQIQPRPDFSVLVFALDDLELVGFISDSVMTAWYFPAGIGS